MKTMWTTSGWEKDAPAEPVLAEIGFDEDFAPETDETYPTPWLLVYLRHLWERRQDLVRTTVLGATATAILAFSMAKRFESTTRLMPLDNQFNSQAALFAKVGSETGPLPGDLLGMKSSGALFAGMLESRTVQDRMIERFDLKKVYRIHQTEVARKQLAKNTVIYEDRKSGIVAITVTDKVAQRAAALSNAYAEELNRIIAEMARSTARRERIFMEERLKAVKLELDSAARDFGEFSSKNVAIDIDQQGKTLVESAALLHGQLVAAKSELAGLKQIYTNGNTRVLEISARIQELQSHLDTAGGEPGVEHSEPMRPSDSFYPSIRKLPLLGVAYSDLSRKKEIQENVYENLTQLLELLKIQEAREMPSINVLDSANVPESKSFPPRFKMIFLGTLLSGLGGIIWVVSQAYWQERTSWTHPHRVRLRQD